MTPTSPDIDPPGIGDGSVREIIPGLHWLRMAVGGRLEWVNVWAFRDPAGWTVVDTGLRDAATAVAWRCAVADGLAGAAIRRVLVTHFHPDHSGMAGWLARHHDATLWMSPLEYFTLRTLTEETAEAPAEAICFFRAAGWNDEQLDDYRTRFGALGKLIYPLPPTFVGLRDGQTLAAGGLDWKVITARGHSPDQVLLHCETAKLLIAADHILEHISPNVSVTPREPEADPLSDFLESLAHVREVVPDDVLVLPSHGVPFRGLHARIDALITGHEDRLSKLQESLVAPQSAIAVFKTLFRREIGRDDLYFATGESLAHLNCLRQRGLAERCEDELGIDRWHAVLHADA